MNMKFIERFFPKDHISLPDEKLQISVGGGFDSAGKEFLNHFISMGELKPYEAILDVGCGCGRMSLPLTTYLNNKGRYDGFDIVKESVAWCQQNISKKYPNFNFKHSDIYNKEYNKNGKINSRDFIFPYDDNSFDFIFLTSVFTHMLPEDMEHYFSEISRTLKNGGRCLISFFLLNEESRLLMKEKPQQLKFEFDQEIFRTIDADIPEKAISYDEKYIKQVYLKNNIRIKYPIHYGFWCSRSTHLSYQDIIIGIKDISKS